MNTKSIFTIRILLIFMMALSSTGFVSADDDVESDQPGITASENNTENKTKLFDDAFLKKSQSFYESKIASALEDSARLQDTDPLLEAVAELLARDGRLNAYLQGNQERRTTLTVPAELTSLRNDFEVACNKGQGDMSANGIISRLQSSFSSQPTGPVQTTTDGDHVETTNTASGKPNNQFCNQLREKMKPFETALAEVELAESDPIEQDPSQRGVQGNESDNEREQPTIADNEDEENQPSAEELAAEERQANEDAFKEEMASRLNELRQLQEDAADAQRQAQEDALERAQEQANQQAGDPGAGAGSGAGESGAGQGSGEQSPSEPPNFSDNGSSPNEDLFQAPKNHFENENNSQRNRENSLSSLLGDKEGEGEGEEDNFGLGSTSIGDILGDFGSNDNIFGSDDDLASDDFGDDDFGDDDVTQDLSDEQASPTDLVSSGAPQEEGSVPNLIGPSPINSLFPSGGGGGGGSPPLAGGGGGGGGSSIGGEGNLAGVGNSYAMPNGYVTSAGSFPETQDRYGSGAGAVGSGVSPGEEGEGEEVPVGKDVKINKKITIGGRTYILGDKIQRGFASQEPRWIFDQIPIKASGNLCDLPDVKIGICEQKKFQEKGLRIKLSGVPG